MELDPIREGKSLEKLKTMNGNEGLANMLKVNLKVCIFLPYFLKKIFFF